ncbi:MAG: hypothetical protein HY812_19605 [Planctomycetes bacterium]|nr:hypothetical protein [Planctomycetota bacterium]
MADAAPARAERRKAWAVLAGLLALLLAERLAILFFAVDDVFVPGYELFPMGVLANELLHGLPSLSVFEFHDTHSGGQILSALLSAGTFALLGASCFALKLVPVLFAALTLLVSYRFVLKRFGLAAAAFCGAALVCAPATYVDYSSANFGNHSEVLFFLALSLAPCFALFVDGRRDARTRFLFGLTCGLAVWYALSSLLVVALYLVLWLAAEGLFFLKRAFLPWLLGFAAGTLPLWYVLLTYEAPQTKWMEAKFAGRGVTLERAPGRFAEFFGDLLPRSPCFYDLPFLAGAVLDRILVLLWLAAALFLAVRWFPGILWFLRRLLPPWRGFAVDGRSLLVLFLGYPLALACTYAFSNFKIGNWAAPEWGGFRYLLTLHYLLLLLLVLAFAELRRMGRTRLAAGLAGLVVLVGAAGNAGHSFSADSAGKALCYEGFYYPQMARVFLLPRYDDKQLVVDALEGLPPRRRAECYLGIGVHEALLQMRAVGRRAGRLRIDEILAPFPAEYRPFIAQGIGAHVAAHPSIKDGKKETSDQAMRAIFEHPGPERLFLVQGLFLGSEMLVTARGRERAHRNSIVLEQVPADLRVYAYQGLGLFVGSLLWRGIEAERVIAEEVMSRVSGAGRDDWREAFYNGVGAACLGYWEDPARFDARIAETIPEAARRHVYWGLGWMSDLVLREGREVLARLSPDLAADLREQVAAGLAWRKGRREPSPAKGDAKR